MKDYDRSWKDYQRTFNSYEVESTRVKHDAEENILKENNQYVSLLAELEETRKNFASTCPNSETLDKEITQLTTQRDLIDQKVKLINAKNCGGQISI